MLYAQLFLAAGLCLTSVSGFYVKNNPAVVTAQPARLYQHEGIAVPKPTAGPGDKDLRRRESAQVTQRSVLEAPDNTCGFFGGSSAQPWGCTAGANCVFATATIVPHAYVNGTNATETSTSAPAVGSVLCCDSQTGCPALPAPTACVDKGRYDYNKTCTGNCPKDPMTLKCTSGIYLYCNTISFSAPAASALFCNYLSTYDALPAETTYVGQANRTLTPTVLHFATTTNPPIPTVVVNTTSTASTTPSATPAPSSMNKKALIGGVVGGILGLALIAGLVILFLRWRMSGAEAEETVPKAILANGKGDSNKSLSIAQSQETLSKVSSVVAVPENAAAKN